ncbi:carbohydrate-binding domain-containing protein [Lachnobacterium bovis]|uniref:carbohydrate-binding domain-containing protein n=1 Tax=Lachnobacterium bovis TaxID=140626 RepID=UPI0003B5EDA1|nr:carbohydrate-binding domain-containing protein [Lachnobacterium bovis]
MKINKKLFVIIFCLTLLVVTTCVFAMIINENHSGNAAVDLSDEKIVANGEGVVLNKSNIIINRAGVYDFSGKISDKHIIVDVKSGNVVINFSNVVILTKNYSPIQIKRAHKVTLNIEKNTTNTLTFGDENEYNKKLDDKSKKDIQKLNNIYQQSEGSQQDNLKIASPKTTKESKSKKDTVKDFTKHFRDRAVISTEVPLEIRGSGDLFINAYRGSSIVSQSDLNFYNANLTIKSCDNAVVANKNIDFNGGLYTISSGNRGVYAGGYINGSLAKIKVQNGQAQKKAFCELYQNERIDAMNKYMDSQTYNNYLSGLDSESGISLNKSKMKLDTFGNAISAQNDITLIENTLNLKANNNAILCEGDLKTVKNDCYIENSYNAIVADAFIMNDKYCEINCNKVALKSKSYDKDIKIETGKYVIRTKDILFWTSKSVVLKNSNVYAESSSEDENSICKNSQTNGTIVVNDGKFIACVKKFDEQILNDDDDSNYCILDIPENILDGTDYNISVINGPQFYQGKFVAGTKKIICASNKLQDKLKFTYADKVYEYPVIVVDDEENN